MIHLHILQISTNYYYNVYDNLCNKKLTGIYISTNNKTYEDYCEIFLSIRKYNLGILKNNISIVKWITYTINLEIELYSSFNNAFHELDNLSHLGCFFHYMKNNYKYILENGYKSNENNEVCKYIIKNIYTVVHSV